MMWSATRSACATMVRPGLTAADEGKNDASTTKRFATSCVRHQGSSTDVRGSVPNAERAALVRGVLALVRVRHHFPESEPVQDARRLLDERVRAPRGCSDGSAAGCARPRPTVTRLSSRGRSSDIASQSTPRATQASYAHTGIHGNHGLRHDAVRAALGLDVAERELRVRSAEVEVVDRDGLLEDRVVRPQRIESLHHRRQVRHVAPADEPGRVREAVRMCVARRSQQQRRRVDRAARDDDERCRRPGWSRRRARRRRPRPSSRRDR